MPADSEGRGMRMGMPHLYGPQSGGGAGVAHDDGAKVLPMAGKERRKPGVLRLRVSIRTNHWSVNEPN